MQSSSPHSRNPHARLRRRGGPPRSSGGNRGAKIAQRDGLPTMFAFCVDELGFSEDQAYNRTTVARAARRFPAMLDSLRSGAVHLTGLRLLARRLTEQNHRDVLAEAAGKSKRQIEEIVARLDPKPPVPDSFRKRPVGKQATLEMTQSGSQAESRCSQPKR